MQDWEWEVADASRIDEFVDAYESGEHSEDKRFTLMETVLHSSEDAAAPSAEQGAVPLAEQARWPEVVELHRLNIDLHAYPIYYRSSVEDDSDDEIWKVTPFLRQNMNESPDAFLP